jgi:molybdopterin-guanine dinucleotide biosynthesis protein A
MTQPMRAASVKLSLAHVLVPWLDADSATTGRRVGRMGRMAPTTRNPSYPVDSITGLVLAGGLGRRMGGEDKGLVPLAGRPMVAHVLEAMRPQVGTIVVNANRNHDLYAAFGHPVIADEIDGYQGPLAGVLTGLRHCTTELLVTAPCDAPLVAPDLVARLYAALDAAEADIAVASDGERRQPVFLLLRASLAPSLEAYLAGGDRKVDIWLGQLRVAEADLSDRPDTFINVNDAGERQHVEARLVSTSTSR